MARALRGRVARLQQRNAHQTDHAAKLVADVDHQLAHLASLDGCRRRRDHCHRGACPPSYVTGSVSFVIRDLSTCAA
jgi:hypothetical protein